MAVEQAHGRCDGKASKSFLIDNILRARRRHVKSRDGDSSSSPTPPNSPLLHPLPLVTFPAAHYAPHAPVLMSPFLPRSYPVLFAPPLQYYQRPPFSGSPHVAAVAQHAAAVQSRRPPSTSDDEEDSDDSSAENGSETCTSPEKRDGELSPGDKQRDAFRKKKRTAFTTAQLQELEGKFGEQKYLTKADRTRLAKRLGLTEKHVKTWYQNRRTKWKRGATELEGSVERERSATAMYRQFVNQKGGIGTLAHQVFHT